MVTYQFQVDDATWTEWKNTVPLKRPSDCIEVVSVSNLFAKAIRHIYTDQSVSTLFTE